MNSKTIATAALLGLGALATNAQAVPFVMALSRSCARVLSAGNNKQQDREIKL